MTTPFSDGPATPQSFSSHLDTLSPESLMSTRQSSPSDTSSLTQRSTVSTTEASPNELSQEPEKKPAKKRKSWGQQLPTPTTNLPPRKRAKTAEEKEQRRVERVLRNRAAAQKSREVKKQQLEKIEKERDDLKDQNDLLQQQNRQLETLNEQLLQQTRRLAEENQKLRQQSPHPPSAKDECEFGFSLSTVAPGASFTLDPTTLLATPERSPTLKLEEPPYMTHQPAALVCDLRCLQGGSTLTGMCLLVWVIATVFSTLTTTKIRVVPTLTLGWLLLQNPTHSSALTTSWKNSSTVGAELLHHLTTLVCSLVALAHLRIATAYRLQPDSECSGIGEAPGRLNFLDMMKGGEVMGSILSRVTHSYEVAEGRGRGLFNGVSV